MAADQEALNAFKLLSVNRLGLKNYPLLVKISWPLTDIPVKLVGADPLFVIVAKEADRFKLTVEAIHKACAILEEARDAKTSRN